MSINTRKVPLYQALARHVAWTPPEGTEFVQQRKDEINALLSMLPSGSGWDEGTKLEETSVHNTLGRLVLSGSFHHMDEHGSYDGWTEHLIIVKPSLEWGFKLHITGPDRNRIKEYLYDMFETALREEVSEWSSQAQEARAASEVQQ